jgi:type I site-specific restriction endonuclease
MPASPEAQAREEIDRLLTAAGWHLCGVKDSNIHAARDVAIREFPLAEGYGYADYLLYVEGKAAGVIEAKKVGATLTRVEVQSGRYAKGLPASLPAFRRPLPFVYESTGLETHFTNGLGLDAKARIVFTFHRPEVLAEWLAPLSLGRGDGGEGSLFIDVPPIECNPAFPIETFDIIVSDEAHRSIYKPWRQVPEYFDAHLIGLTATPNKQTFGFFNQNPMSRREVRWIQPEKQVAYDPNTFGCDALAGRMSWMMASHQEICA